MPALHSNLGETWNPDNPDAFNTGTGSFGAERLDWAADPLAYGKPTSLMFHHHPLSGTLALDEDGLQADVIDKPKAAWATT